MRIFTAIPLPEEKRKLAGEIFRGRLPVAYVNTANLHITLNFFGELGDDEVEKVKKIFSEAVHGQKSFDIEFDKIIKFHQQIHMTVKPNKPLNRIQSELEQKFQETGFNFQDRAYYPHVKLANLHMDHVMNPERKLENFPNTELKQLNFIASKVVLYESKLLLHHAHHTPILEQKLL
ncbi:MAG: RNA 2',3'-cyclic phosphodiesterase [Candidatus Doudnabacteria bacterium]|nr:RNA 2',3'-cyclic phosphodiesterase [Candidatus Doudnabacteria bacterium]